MAHENFAGHLGSAVRPRLILFIMLITNIVYTVDRVIPVIIAEHIKIEFDLSDTQLGIFTGALFSISFCLSGLLFGPLSDRFNRTWILGGMTMCWSAFTALTALAVSYWQLVLLRFCVGATEGGGSPVTLSILSDVFPPERRGSAIGIFKMGSPIGYFIASAGCGYIASEFGWRFAVLVAGLPGMLIALAIFRWVPDIHRGALDRPDEAGERYAPGNLIMTIWSSPGLMLSLVGLYFYTFSNLSIQTFLMPFLSRVHDMPLTEAGFFFAIATALGGISPLVLGLLNDRAMRRGIEFPAYLTMAIAIVSTVACVLMLTTANRGVLIGSLLIWQILALGISAVNFAAVVSLTPAPIRGTVLALLLVGNIFFGMGLGPIVLGSISDALGGGVAIREASILVSSMNLVAIVLFAAAGLQLGRMRRVGLIRITL